MGKDIKNLNQLRDYLSPGTWALAQNKKQVTSADLVVKGKNLDLVIEDKRGVSRTRIANKMDISNPLPTEIFCHRMQAGFRGFK